MAKYSTVPINSDASVYLDEHYLQRADVHIDAALIARGITPSELSLPQPLLTELALTIALRLACIEQAMSNDKGESPLLARAREYQKVIDGLTDGITRQAVGLLPLPGSGGFGTFTVGRG